ncbi:MAG: hypothetical protein WKF94_05370 [Solirubrobacteraceae bacterium]
MGNLNIRLRDEDEDRIERLAMLRGEDKTRLVRRLLAQEEQRYDEDSTLIEQLIQDFRTATFTLNDQLGVDVTTTPVTVDPVGRPHTPIGVPLTNFAHIGAREEADGRLTIELRGIAHTQTAGTRVPVATVPPFPGVSVTVQILDLHPASTYTGGART